MFQTIDNHNIYSHVASALGRSGVGHLRVIDFDRVTLSSLNRHAFALREDVGISKVKFFLNAYYIIKKRLNAFEVILQELFLMLLWRFVRNFYQRKMLKGYLLVTRMTIDDYSNFL
jgi:hypothetical protein